MNSCPYEDLSCPYLQYVGHGLSGCTCDEDDCLLHSFDEDEKDDTKTIDIRCTMPVWAEVEIPTELYNRMQNLEGSGADETLKEFRHLLNRYVTAMRDSSVSDDVQVLLAYEIDGQQYDV